MYRSSRLIRFKNLFWPKVNENHDKRLKRLRSSRPRCTSKTEVSNKFQEG